MSCFVLASGFIVSALILILNVGNIVQLVYITGHCSPFYYMSRFFSSTFHVDVTSKNSSCKVNMST